MKSRLGSEHGSPLPLANLSLISTEVMILNQPNETDESVLWSSVPFCTQSQTLALSLQEILRLCISQSAGRKQ